MRFLCLHGMGTGAAIFEAQLSMIRSQLVGKHDFIFLQGEENSDPAPGIETFYPGPYHSYYNVPTEPQVRAAFELLDEFIEDEGPFDGIIGFSQGAALAASYVLQDSKKSPAKQTFKCAVFFCASMPFNLDSQPFTVGEDGTCTYAGTSKTIPSIEISEMLPESSSAGYSGLWDSSTPFLWRYSKDAKDARIEIPTTHIYASNDSYCGQSRALRELCLPQNLEVLEHRGGHGIPRDRNTTGKIVQCLQNMLHAVLVG